jgi:hypothetical protein
VTELVSLVPAALLLMLSPRLLSPLLRRCSTRDGAECAGRPGVGGIIMWAMGAIDMLAVLVRLSTFFALDECH